MFKKTNRSKLKPIIEKTINKDSNINRKYLLDLKRDGRLGKNVNIVYIYYLENININYPNKNGNVIYIGESGRSSEPTGVRFSQHISTAENCGGDSGTIYCLSNYYWRGNLIKLKVFVVKSKKDRKETEQLFLTSHLKKYGALPICQGTTGQNYKTSKISVMKIPKAINNHI